MANLNKVQLIGNLCQDPVHEQKKGVDVTKFSIATSFKDSTEYHNIVAWGKLAVICSQYLHKGKQVYVEGRLKTSSWKDNESGKTMYRTEINLNEMQMLGKKDPNHSPKESNYSKNTYDHPSRQSKQSGDDVDLPF